MQRAVEEAICHLSEEPVILKQRHVLPFAFIVLIVFTGEATARMVWNDAKGEPGGLCRIAIAAEERRANIPHQLMAAIALAESGRWDPRRKVTVAWPWTIMAEGKGQYFPTKQEAIAAARAIQARGVRNMDVGCMQINMMYHGNAFANLEEAFEPAANVAYAAKFLRQLHTQMGSWHEAAGRYHSATPEHNQRYKAKIARLWEEQRSGAKAGAIDEQDTATLAPAGSAGQESSLRTRPSSHVAHNRMSQLTSAWRERTGRTGSATVELRSRPHQRRAAMRDARSEASFAANRVQHLAAWREASAHIRAEQQMRGSR